MIRRAAALLLFASIARGAPASGESVVLHFTDGGTAEGLLAASSPDEVALEVAGGRIGWPASSIERVEAKRTALQEYRERAAATGGSPSEIRRLARFALERGLHTYAARLHEELGVEAPRRRRGKPGQEPVRERVREIVVRVVREPPPEPASSAPASPLGVFPSRSRLYAPFGAGLFPVYGGFALPVTPEQQASFLEAQRARRQAFRRTYHHPNAQFQFRLQEALDRRAYGLSFSSVSP